MSVTSFSLIWESYVRILQNWTWIKNTGAGFVTIVPNQGFQQGLYVKAQFFLASSKDSADFSNFLPVATVLAFNLGNYGGKYILK